MKRIVTAALLTVFAATLLLGCGKAGADSSPAVPVSIESKTISLENNGLTVNLEIPVLKGLKDSHLQEVLNRNFQTEADEQQAWISKYRSEDTFTDLPYSLDSSYEVTCNTNGILSIVSEYYSYTGGAHGSTIRSSVNIDVNNSTYFTLNDFYNAGNPDKAIADSIMSQINQNPDEYFGDFASVTSNPSLLPFFINKEGQPVVYFQQYEIAPYAAGILEFPLNSDRKAFAAAGTEGIGDYYIENNTLSDSDYPGNYPQVKNLADKTIQDSINADIKRALESFILKYRNENDEGAIIDYKIANQDNRFLSVVFTSSQFMSDTESVTTLQGVTFDIKSGHQVTSANMFLTMADAKDKINTLLKQAAAAAKTSFSPALGKETGIYISGNKVVFYFVSSSTNETIRLGIPLADLESVMNKEIK